MTLHRNRHRMKTFVALAMFFASLAGGQPQSAPADASKALARGDYKSAEAYYRKLLAQYPQSPEVLSNLGVALEMQGKSSEAIYAFERALRQKQLPRTYALLTEEKCKTRDLDAARPMLAKITREDFQDSSILAVIAPCYLELDEPIESVRVYESLLSYTAYPTDLALIQLAKSYLRAAQFFIGRLSRAPDSSIYMSAISEARATGSRSARSAFNSAAKASPYFQPDLNFSNAVVLWREHPEDAALLYLLSVLSSEQSIQQVEICGERYPDSPYLAQLKAEILADQGHEEEAVAQYDNLIRAHPELPDLFYDQGMLFRKEREWEKALGSFQKQLAKDPDDERSAARISEALIQLGHWKELLDFLSTRVEAPDPPFWALLDFAQAAQILDKPQRAIKALTIAEQNHPSDMSIHYRLMRLYRQTGDSQQAKKELNLVHASPK
jgi:predicted Zn-dependent protease